MSDEVRAAVSALLAAAEVYEPDGTWSEPAQRRLFDRFVAQRWSRVGLAETLGGEGGELSDMLAVLAACTAAGQRLPVAEVLCANRILELSEVELPGEATCVVPVAAPGGQRPVHAERVPWARWASHLLLVSDEPDGGRVRLVDAAGAEISHGQNMAGEPRDSLTLTAPRTIGSATVPCDLLAQLRLTGALLRSVQLAEAVGCALRLSTAHCAAREQFGRPLAKFQAVQQHLAALAGESAAARAAVRHALDRIGSAAAQWCLAPVATAKVRTGMAAGTAAKLAHQLHGAIGITVEYRLHRYTRPLWSWREEYGNEHQWAAALAAELTEGGDLWEALAPAR